MTNMQSNSKANYGKALGIGCLSIVGFLMLAVVAVWLSWGTIKQGEWYRTMSEIASTAKQEFGAIMALQESLKKEYPADEIRVSVNNRVQAQGHTTVLTVTIVNPAFIQSEPGSEHKVKAREIAHFIAADYQSIASYGSLKLTFIHKRGMGFSIEKSSSYVFETNSLLPRTEVDLADDDSAPPAQDMVTP